MSFNNWQKLCNATQRNAGSNVAVAIPLIAEALARLWPSTDKNLLPECAALQMKCIQSVAVAAIVTATAAATATATATANATASVAAVADTVATVATAAGSW